MPAGQTRAGSYSVMVPASHEEAELEATIARLLLSDDPPSEILVVVGDGDLEARLAAEQAAVRHPRLVEVIAESGIFDVPAVRQRSVAGRIPWLAVACSAALIAVAAVVAASIQSGTFVYLLYMSVSLTLAVIASTTLVWMLYAWRTPA